MNNLINRILRHGKTLGLACLLALSFITPAVHAGLTFNLDLYRNNQGHFFNFYTPMSTNTSAPDPAVGVYIISSPQWPASGSTRVYEMTTNGFNPNPISGQETGYGDYASLMQQITNGNWTILFTNATTTNLYTFTVSAPNMTSNMLPATIITYPSNGALNVPNQPTFTWQGSANIPLNNLYSYLANYDSSFYQPVDISIGQTSWTNPVAMPNGMNCSFNIAYLTNNTTPIFVATTPLNTNAPHLAVSEWESTSTLETGDNVSFAVTNPPSAGTTLIAHYTFDNNGNLGEDTSGNGYDLDFNGGNNVTFSSTAEVGSGAAYFDGNSFFSYTSTPANVLSTLAGDFSLSFWIQTTQNDGNENGDAWAGDGIVAADVPGSAYDLVPAALDGGQVGFNTGPYDDTLNSQTNINDGNYHHVVITRNQTTGEKQIYIDGALNSSDFATMNPLSDPRLVAIGCAIDASQSDPNNANPQQFFQGLLDDLQIYSGVLSSTQVAQIYTSAVGQYFNAALNTTNLTWTTGGDTSWFVETTNTYNGAPAAAQSGSVTNSQSSTLSVTVTGPGTLTFYWASQDDCNNFDYEFDIDGGYKNDIYCSQSWTQDGPYEIAAGQHTLSWTTYAYGDNDPTEVGFLDQVSYVQDTAPVITLNPFNQTNYPGYNVALLAAATNAANSAISWQWFEVGNPSPLPNATNALFIPAYSGTASVAGSYYATATTSGGSANTTTATVSFVNAPLPPDWAHAVKSPFGAVDATTFTKDYYLGCAADSAGDIYAAGQYNGNMDVLTNGIVENVLTAPGSYGAALVKHAANGNPLWAVGLTNNQTGSSYGIAVAAGPGNGAYLASDFSGTNWLGTNKFVDVGGSSILLSRFDANGSNIWSKFIGGTNYVYTSYNMLVSDVSGNVTLVGNMSGTVSFGGTNLSAPAGVGFIVQYDANGAVRWAQTVPVNAYNLAYGSGLLYVSLQSSADSGVTNAAIGSLSNVTDRAWGVACINASNGQPLWLRGLGNQYGANTSGLLNDMPLISASGSNVFLIANAFGSTAVFGGISVPLPGGRCQYFARYDTNGNPQAAISFGSPTTEAWASTANASGVYVCGDFDNYSQFGSEVIAAPVYAQNDLDSIYNGFSYIYFTQPFIAKFDSNGNPLWARNGVSSDLANFRGIATTSDGVWAGGFLKITNSIPAQFGTNSVSSDLQIIVGSPFSHQVWNQAGMIAKITETPSATPVTLINPHPVGANFQFQFLSAAGFSHNILYRTNLAVGSWQTNSTVSGDGTVKIISLPFTLFSPAKQGFIRVSTQ